MGDTFLASSVVPTSLEAIDPAFFAKIAEGVIPGSGVVACKNTVSPVAEGDRTASGPSEAVLGILSAFSAVVSRWFSVMREAIGRERARQSRFREDNGLPKSAKIPYATPALTESDRAIASLSEAVIRSLAGDFVAEYARTKFLHAIDTGDMRAFKIRLLVLKARDSILDPMLKAEFSAGAAHCIDMAEEQAGCKPDGSPRRLSRAEQERKKRLDAIRNAKLEKQKAQMELPLVWPKDDKGNAVQDIEEEKVSETKEELESNSSISANDRRSSIYCNYETLADHGKQKNKAEGSRKNTVEEKNGLVTVTEDKVVTVTASCYSNKSGVVRKARDYENVEEIIEDIDAGKIVPYGSTEEIIEDVSSGFLTREEALLFAAALDRYCPEESDLEHECLNEVESEDDLDNDDLVCDDDEEDEDEDDGFSDYGDAEGDAVSDRDDGVGTGFSYNPDGFGGLEGEEDED